MVCYNPIKAFNILNEKTENGKNVLTFKHTNLSGKPYIVIDLPCGQCIGCRIERSRSWAIRCIHEASLYKDKNSFITLTYDDKNINESGTLIKKDFQNFMKELRRQHSGFYATKKGGKLQYPIRYFHCGEYGEACRGCGFDREHCYCNKYIKGIGRPHHHACIFNFDFPDKKFQKRKNGHNWYNSESLSKIWNKGYHAIGDVSFDSAAYVARYICKKITGEKSEEHYKRCNPQTAEIHEVIPEYITMSRRPGIAKEWYEKHKNDLFPKDFITANGRKVKIPKFYNKMFEETYPKKYDKIKKERRIKAAERPNEQKVKRLIVRHKVKISQYKHSERELK